MRKSILCQLFITAEEEDNKNIYTRTLTCTFITYLPHENITSNYLTHPSSIITDALHQLDHIRSLLWELHRKLA